MGKKLEEVAGRPNRCAHQLAHQLAHLRTNAVARAAAIAAEVYEVFRSGKQPRGFF
jgi:hypothetical protein